MERSVLIIGIGNEDRSDDGLGLLIAKKIRNLTIPDAMVLELADDAARLLDAWTGYDSVILVDALSSGSAPGTIRRFDLQEEDVPSDLFHCSTHAFGVVSSIELARVLNLLPERLILYGIEGVSFEIGTTMSSAAREAVDKAIPLILQDVESLVGNPMLQSEFSPRNRCNEMHSENK